MLSFFSFTLLSCTVASGLALPVESSTAVRHGSGSRQISAEARNGSSVSLRFEAQCYDCFGDARESLRFDVAIHETADAFQGGHVTVNDQVIPWSVITVAGPGLLPSSSTSSLREHELSASWDCACIRDRATILSLSIHQEHHDIVQVGQGSTLSSMKFNPPVQWAMKQIDVTSAGNTEEHWGLKSAFRNFKHRLQEFVHFAAPQLKQCKVRLLKTPSEKEFPFPGLRKQGDAVPHSANQGPVQDLESQVQSPEGTRIPCTAHLAIPSTSSDHPFSTPSTLTSESSKASPSPVGPDDTKDFGSWRLAAPELPPFRLISYVVPSVLFFVVVSSLAFLCARCRKSSCISTRRRSLGKPCHGERECHSTHKQVAKTKAWLGCWRKKPNFTRTADYNEEQVSILEQEKFPEDTVQKEILGCRIVGEIVWDILQRAEEGRSRFFYDDRHGHQINTNDTPTHKHFEDVSPTVPAPTHHPRFTNSSTMLNERPDSLPPRYRRSSLASSTLSTSSILPPSYEQELGLEGDLDVADGFMYSPNPPLSAHDRYQTGLGRGFLSHRGEAAAAAFVVADEGEDEATPESSVVSCSPRMSFETATTEKSM